MFYARLNAKGQQLAALLAERAGLQGRVVTELTPAGDKAAFFKLKTPARGAEVEGACKQLKEAGFTPDYLPDFGAGPCVKGGFVGKGFSDKATRLPLESGI